MSPLRRLRCLLPLLAVLNGTAAAAGISVSPIRLELTPGQGSTAFTVSNDNDDGRVMQVTVLRWTRDAGGDQYTPAGDADPIVTPPLFQLAPHGSQVVRLGFLHPPAPAAAESAWRVFVEEAPLPASQSGPGITLRLRIGVPLFLLPGERRQALRWTRGAYDGSELRLTARNDGNVSERIDQLSLSAGGAEAGHLPGPIYIFPGESRVLAVPLSAAPAGALRLLARGTPAAADSNVALPPQ